MALVVLLRGVNVGGYRKFRPAVLAGQLRHLDAVNIGAAGTFVIRRPVTQAKLRAEIAKRLPFDADVAIVPGADIVRLVQSDPFEELSAGRDVVRFVSFLTARPRSMPPIPSALPPDGEWLLKIVALEKRFVIGVYRRQMKAIAYLGALDRLFGVPVTTRNWNTVLQIANVLGA